MSSGVNLDDIKLDYLSDLSQPWAQDAPVECSFLTGPAGTGKTTWARNRIEEDPSYGVLCATTGIAAVNLDTITLNSLIGYFDTASLEDHLYSGRLGSRLGHLIAQGKKNLVIDEVSMMPAEQLQCIYQAASGANALAKHADTPLGLAVTGDFCQLPPIKAKWAFEAECWPKFAANTTRLEKIWRQDNPVFLEALRLAREGDGPGAVGLLEECGVEFADKLTSGFDGTTILPKNDAVERYNAVQLQRGKGQKFSLRATRWGSQRGEWIWKEHRGTGIPDVARFRVGSLVMILANDAPEFTYCNGDLGTIVDISLKESTVTIRLKRTGREVQVRSIERLRTTSDMPEGFYEEPETAAEARRMEAEARAAGDPWFDWKSSSWVTGTVRYFPIRLGYASTVHKSQGLTLDRIQVDIRHGFFGAPNMAYVALSRVRSPEGLRVVGTPELLAKRIVVHPKVRDWI